MTAFWRALVEAWRATRPPRRPPRVARVYRLISDRYRAQALLLENAKLHEQINTGPTEGHAFVWRQRLQAAERGLRRVAADRKRLQKRVYELARENRALKAQITERKHDV